MIEGIPCQTFMFEKEKLDQLDRELGSVLQLSQETLRAEAIGYLDARDFKIWESIDTDKGRLCEPRLESSGKASARSVHSEAEVLQAIVYIERWKAARRSAGARRAAITRKHNAIKHKQLAALAKETRHPSPEQLLNALTIK